MHYEIQKYMPSIIGTLAKILNDDNYILKGGQALAIHIKEETLRPIRMSRDIDIAFKEMQIPIDLHDSMNKFIESYNDENHDIMIKPETVKFDKLPKNNEDEYYGMQITFCAGKRKTDNTPGTKIYFTDIEGSQVIIDINVNEVVKKEWIIFKKEIRLAAVPLIVAEKIRALCTSYLAYKNGQLDVRSRPKDFFDIFLVYNILYKKTKNKDEIKCISEALEQVLQIKELDKEIIELIYEPGLEEFHKRDYKTQVLDTIIESSIYKNTEFAQAYSDTLELIDEIKKYKV